MNDAWEKTQRGMMSGDFTAHIILKFKHDILYSLSLISYIQNLMFIQGNCWLFKHTNILLNFTTKIPINVEQMLVMYI